MVVIEASAEIVAALVKIVLVTVKVDVVIVAAVEI